MLLLRSDFVAPREHATDEGECTTAVIAGFATASGRPLLWKNRDVSLPDQEIVYFEDGRYPYVTITTAGDSTQAWGGVNAAGFAVEDANNWNTADTVQGPEDDGTIIKLALRTCATVEDFQAILDSTSVAGHTQPAIFGVIDAAGGAAMFETFAHSYLRYDANDPEDAPRGILVRSNFSYAGSTSGRIGVYRHDRSKELIEAAARSSQLTAKYICRTVARDLRISETFDPYPLPYEGQQGNLPRGWINTYGATCRRLSVSGCVVEGVTPGENPLLATLWAFPMAVQYGVALPFWVAGGETPAEVNGDSTAPLCDIGLRIKARAQHYDGFCDTLDTYILNNGVGGGIHATTFPLEDTIFARAEARIATWRDTTRFSKWDMARLTAELARLAYDSLSGWPGPGDLIAPPRAPQNLTAWFTVSHDVQLRWSAVTQDTLGAEIAPRGYTIWRAISAGGPFESVGFTAETEFTMPCETEREFFRVTAVTE
ncbi:MAG: carcinine hydrolase/isopenicillin-N N-acyltransferase family protein [bacterium]|nr:carcinine hydrolase/isopenicillin-N N-acyltransferase family protein [bacterium]